LTVRPRVSIVVPVLNGEQHLESCLRSVLAQTFVDFELVIADNASSDHTAEIISSFNDERIRLLPPVECTLDVHANWTRAVSAACGEFVKVVCHDDLLAPECVAVQVGLLDDHPTAVLVAGRRHIIDDEGRVIIDSRGLGRLLGTGDSKLLDGSGLVKTCVREGSNLIGEPMNVLIRRSALPDPLFDVRWRFCLDLEFYFRVVTGHDVVVDGRTLCSFRVSPKQMSASLATVQAAELRALFEETSQRVPDVTKADVRIGSVRAHLLAKARSLLYRIMRVRAMLGSRWSRKRVAPKTMELSS
jgi:glycosyltransferase involved in cell wall biosynthesis